MKPNEYNQNYMRNKKNKQRSIKENIEIALMKSERNREINEKKYGKYRELISVGENDRICGSKPQIFEDESMQTSYSYGFYEKGSKVLEGNFARGLYTNEEQKNLGIMDIINSVPEKFVNNLKEYPAYLEGRVYQMGKKACDFIVEQGMTIDEYISIMSIINPEINNSAFVDGYNDRYNELTNKKHK